MKHLLTIFAVAAAFILGATQANAAARIEQLRIQRGGAGSCTADRVWCIAQTGATLTIRHNENRAYRDVAQIPLPSHRDDRIDSRPWPSIIRVALPRQPEFALVGVERTQSEMYSGGGASTVRLTLFEVRPGAAGEPRAVLEAPLSGNVLIRACFTPNDERRRRGACHDEDRYSATLLAPPQPANAVRLIYRSRADSFPGRRSRFHDSGRDAPLRKADLYRAVDRTCTVERTVTRNSATGMLNWSAPLPPCREYLEMQ